MIEIENMQSTVTDHTLRMVLLFCDIETKDKLLYEGDEYYRVMPNDGLSRSSTPLFERGINLEYRYSSGAGVP